MNAYTATKVVARRHTKKKLSLCAFVFVGISIAWTDAWQHRTTEHTRYHLNMDSAAKTTAVAILSALCWTGTQTDAIAAAPSSPGLEERVQSMLKAPTEDRPQIPLPSSGGNSKFRSSAISKANDKVKALISLSNPQKDRPYANDVLVVQVWDSEQRSLLLGGAKIPVAKIRSFPVMIQLGPPNAKVLDWTERTSRADLWIEATICPEDSSSSCSPDEQRFVATGLSKLLTQQQLPGIGDEEGIRVPASLALTMTGNQVPRSPEIANSLE